MGYTLNFMPNLFGFLSIIKCYIFNDLMEHHQSDVTFHG